MKLKLEETMCTNGRTCPNVNRSDRGTVVVQGYVVDPAAAAALGLEAGETVVEIPVGLLREGVVAEETRLLPTGQETVLVVGKRVTDPEALAELQLPDGEDAVEVAAAKEVSHAR